MYTVNAIVSDVAAVGRFCQANPASLSVPAALGWEGDVEGASAAPPLPLGAPSLQPVPTPLDLDAPPGLGGTPCEGTTALAIAPHNARPLWRLASLLGHPACSSLETLPPLVRARLFVELAGAVACTIWLFVVHESIPQKLSISLAQACQRPVAASCSMGAPHVDTFAPPPETKRRPGAAESTGSSCSSLQRGPPHAASQTHSPVPASQAPLCEQSLREAQGHSRRALSVSSLGTANHFGVTRQKHWSRKEALRGARKSVAERQREAGALALRQDAAAAAQAGWRLLARLRSKHGAESGA
jgi:hypothetical protein